jgi:hypothetical protein
MLKCAEAARFERRKAAKEGQKSRDGSSGTEPKSGRVARKGAESRSGRVKSAGEKKRKDCWKSKE